MSETKIQEWGWDEFEESMQPETGSGYVKIEDHLRILQSTRQAIADTKAQLEALEDALNIVKLFDPLHGGIGIHTDEEADAVEESKILVDRAIQNSRTRKQG